MKPLRVLQVSHGFPPAEHAGAELCCFYQSRELGRRGHEVRVFTRTADPEVEDFAIGRDEVEGVPVARLKFPTDTARSLEDTYRSDWVGAQFEKEMGEGVDVVHLHHMLGLSTDLVSRAKRRGAAVVVTLHDFWYLCPRGQRYTPRDHLCTEIEPWRCSLCIAKKRGRYALNALAHTRRDPETEHTWGRTLKSPLKAVARGVTYAFANLNRRPIEVRTRFILGQLAQADVVLSPSQFVLDEYSRHGLNGPRMEVSENGIDAAWSEEFTPLNSPHAPLRFGFLGSFLPSKGVDLLVDAFRDVPHGDAELHLHGTSPWDGGRFARRAEASNRHPGVHFHGVFARDRLSDVLKEIDVLVVPSRWFENAPVTLDEAALARIPVVVADHGGMREVLARRQNGLGFRPGDTADLHRTLRRFLDEPDLWSTLRDPKTPVRTVQDQATQLEHLYRSLI